MDSNPTAEVTRIGLDDEWKAALSRDTAQSLLRMCAPPGNDDRTYTNVQVLSVPNGSSLYIKSQMYG